MVAQASASEITERILSATEDYEFRSFVVGLARDPRPEDPLHEPPSDLKARIGLALLKRWPDRRVDFEHPEVRIEVEANLGIRVRPTPLFLAGRYRKLTRFAPGARWAHPSCKGRGCAACGFSGNIVGPSVQEIFSGPALQETGGEETFFHALGREDTDALMLGRGRPFILEVRAPRRRRPDLAVLSREVARQGRDLAEWLRPCIVERSGVRLVKEAGAEKTYRAWIRFDGDPPADTAERAAAFAGLEIEQYSPTRVMHRRGRDKLRRRRVLASAWLGEIDGLHVWEVRAESGTYIKELISGDRARTRPSLSEACAREAVCVRLDVLDIHWKEPWAPRSGLEQGGEDTP